MLSMDTNVLQGVEAQRRSGVIGPGYMQCHKQLITCLIHPHLTVSPPPVCLCLLHTDIYSLLLVYAIYAHSHTGIHMATHCAWNLVLIPMSINPWKEGLRLGKTGSPVPSCVKKLFTINDIMEMTEV